MTDKESIITAKVGCFCQAISDKWNEPVKWGGTGLAMQRRTVQGVSPTLRQAVSFPESCHHCDRRADGKAEGVQAATFVSFLFFRKHMRCRSKGTGFVSSQCFVVDLKSHTERHTHTHQLTAMYNLLNSQMKQMAARRPFWKISDSKNSSSLKRALASCTASPAHQVTQRRSR